MADFQQKIVSLARAAIGAPFVHQGAHLRRGCDCFGLIIGVWCEITGEDFGPVAPYPAGVRQAQAHTQLFAHHAHKFVPIAAHRPFNLGEVLVFSLRRGAGGKHLGILAQNEQGLSIIHAHNGAGVIETAFSAPWHKRLSARFSFPIRG